MKQYEMTLVDVSEKRVRIGAESAEATTEMLEKVYSESSILDFSNRDVTDVSILAKAADMEAGEAFLRYRETDAVLHSGEGVS